MLTVVYDLLFDEIAALARQVVLAYHVRATGLARHYVPHSAPRLLHILVLLVHSELLVDDIFVLTVFIFVAVIVLFLIVVLIGIVVVLGNVFLARCFVILIHDSDLVAVLAVVGVERVLPRHRALIVLFGSDVDLLLVLMVVVSSLPSAAMVMAGLGSDVGLPYQQVLRAKHIAQVLRLLPH